MWGGVVELACISSTLGNRLHADPSPEISDFLGITESADVTPSPRSQGGMEGDGSVKWKGMEGDERG